MRSWLRRFTEPLGELVDPRVVIGSDSEPLLGLVARMRERAAAVALITDASARFADMLTAQDLLDRALFALDPGEPVAVVLSRGQSALRSHDRIYRALAEMRRQHRDCLPVVDAAGQPLGIIHLNALLTAPFADVLERLDTAVGIAAAASSSEGKSAQASLCTALLEADQSASDAIALINALNDDSARAVLREALAGMAAAGWGDPPVPFAVIVMGSAGRRESLLHPDQDNGFILGDHPEAAHRGIDQFFVELASRFTRGLDQIGFPFCPGGVMATNPLWRKTLPEWQSQVSGWMHARGNEAIMFSDIFFDFRAVDGPDDLAAALRRYVTETARGNLPFLAQISWLQTEHATSVDLFGQLIARDGADGGAFDLKLRAMKPLVEIVRLLALQHGVEATGTLPRLAALGACGALAEEDGERLSGNAAFLFDLLLRHQLGCISSGNAADNLIRPEAIERTERERLVQVCRDIERWQRRLAAEYFPGLG
jgi:CBS domain-containing protein